MPLYNSSTTATALGVSQKWLDNLLSHNKIGSIQQGGQGVSRRLSIESIAIISVARTVTESLHVPTGQAVALAERMIASGMGEVALSPVIRVTVDLPRLRESLLQALAHAVEVTPNPARGRPAGR